MVLFIAMGPLIVIDSVSTASRLVWSFARDDALLGSGFVKRIDPRQKIPVNALMYNAVWIAVLGCLYLASITGASIILILLIISLGTDLICLL